MKFLLTLSLLLLTSWFSHAQTEYRRYAIKVVGIKVGELLASKSVSSENISTYKLSSKVDVNFLVYHLKVDYKVSSLFKEQEMYFSEVIVKSNRGNFNTKTEKTNKGYKLKSKQPKKDVEKALNLIINDTFSKIHFHEPIGVSQVYAEFYGDFIKIKPLGNHKYSGILEDNVDEYYYEKGLLTKAVKKNAITDMVIVLEKSWVE